MTRRTMSTALVAFLLLSGLAARAHKPSDSYLSLASHGGHIDGTWDIALRDLDDAVGLDDDGDGTVTWGELRKHQVQIAAYALPRLRLSMGGSECASEQLGLQVDSHTDGAYAVLHFSMDCKREGEAIQMTYSLLFDIDPSHRGLVRLSGPHGVQTAVFSPAHATQELHLSSSSGIGQFATFLREGVFHIWTGFDHILFLLALLLPVVVRRKEGHWVPVDNWRVALREVLKVVTMFTLAHSLTLSLAALGIVQLPSRLVESAIALSVLLAALNNLWPFLHGKQWAFAFGFGLLHGFGFASVLTDMGLPAVGLARALFGFNVGVELGQLAIVAGFLALAYPVRRPWIYQRVVLGGGSVGIATLSSVWLIERAFDLRFLPI